MLDKVIIYTDGGARNNPGPAAVGIVIYSGGKRASRFKQFLGNQTNNWAEYEAVHLALVEAKRLGLGGADVEVRLDSKLVAEQLMGRWKVKEPSLKPQWSKVRAQIAADFPRITFVHIPREENAEADTLVNEALDEELNI